MLVDHNGKAVFSSKIPETQKHADVPIGKFTLLYTTHTLPAQISDEKDIDQYIYDREHGLGPGVACPPGGSCANILHMAPGLKTPLRKLPTLGMFYVLEGNITLHLDSGEERKMKAGDAGVIRSAMHSWTNETPSGGWAKLLAFSQYVESAE